MKILYIGDIMGEAGIEAVERVMLEIKSEYSPDLVIAQSENVTAGRGMDLTDFSRLKAAGVQFFTGGNHIFDNKALYDDLKDPKSPVIRPANYPLGTVGKGYAYAETEAGRVLIISLLGQIVGRQSTQPLDNPLQVIDGILRAEQGVARVATIVNYHGDFSSEKVIIGHYLDGRVTAVIGDHWHIPTADARVLPKGTAHITDVGMCGALNSSLGVTFDSVIPRWRDGVQTRNVLESEGPRQFNAVLIDCNQLASAESITQIQKVLD